MDTLEEIKAGFIDGDKEYLISEVESLREKLAFENKCERMRRH